MKNSSGYFPEEFLPDVPALVSDVAFGYAQFVGHLSALVALDSECENLLLPGA